jgi:type II secretory pathway pseudopilin PulG
MALKIVCSDNSAGGQTMLDQKGFSLRELIIAAAVIVLITVLSIPKLIRNADRAKEAEVKANVRSIEIALERYSVDHDYTFPRYIWGGDRQGWDEYYRQGPGTGTKMAIYDPLIRHGYLDSYPRNPFVRNGNSIIRKTSAFKSGDPGTGDPRFGFSGTIMGNGLSDPRYPECDDTLGGTEDGVWGGGSSPALKRRPGRTYTMGGWYDARKKRNFLTHWPGNFFYRSAGEPFEEDAPSTQTVARYSHSNSGDYTGDARRIVQPTRVNRILLGGYGAKRTEGYDLIRMGDIDTGEGGLAFMGVDGAYPVRNYQLADDWGHESRDHPVMFPEVFGKGHNLGSPTWPYRSPENEAFLYASPDGSPDGVVLTLTADPG